MQTNAVYGDIAAIPGFSEPVSSWTHLFAAAVALLIVGPRLIRAARSRNAWTIAVAVFVFGALFLFSMSGTYHLLEPDGEPRAVLQRLDHAAIWTMIAGTFTAMHVVLWRGFWRWGILAIVWTVAITGIVLKTVYFHDMSELVGLVFYLGMGWIGLFTAGRMLRQYGLRASAWMIAGGVFYTLGAVLEFARMPILIEHVVGPHELFHIAVILGAGCHALLLFEMIDVRSQELGVATDMDAASEGAVDAELDVPVEVSSHPGDASDLGAMDDTAGSAALIPHNPNATA